MISMFNKYRLSICFSVAILAIGCGDRKSNTIVKNGAQFTIIEKGKGRKVNEGDYLQLHLAYNSQDGKTIFESADSIGEDFFLQAVKPPYSGSFEEGLLMLHEGDSAHFSVPSDSIFKYTFRKPLDGTLNTGKQLQIVLRLTKVYDAGALKAHLEMKRLRQIETEARAIEIYLLNNALPVQAVNPGVYFYELKKGDGPKPVAGDSVFIRYTGRFLNGEVFDGSAYEGGDVLSYRLGNGERLVEWERAISTMHVGSLVRLILASPNAYGSTGSGIIPPNTPLIYDIELLKIIPASSI